MFLKYLNVSKMPVRHDVATCLLAMFVTVETIRFCKAHFSDILTCSTIRKAKGLLPAPGQVVGVSGVVRDSSLAPSCQSR